MADIIAYTLEIVGLILLVLGYRRNNRNLLLAAALCLWIGAGVNDFVRGFMDAASAG
jgi:hypothetical protein